MARNKLEPIGVVIVVLILMWALFVQPTLAWIMNNLFLLSLVIAVIIVVAYYAHKNGCFN